MRDFRRGATSGVLAGLVSGVIFSLLVSGALSVMLSISVNLGAVVLCAVLGGVVSGLSCGLLYSYTCQKFPVRSRLKTAIAIAATFSLPWGFSWFTILLPSLSIGQNSYTVFIHKLGLETPWVQIPTSSQQLVDLMNISSVSGYILVYLLLVLVWALMFAFIIVYLWNRTKTD